MPIHASDLVPLPTDSPYGNLLSIWSRMLQTRSHIRGEAEKINRDYVARTSSFIDESLVFDIEAYILWYKKILDTSVALFYLIKKWRDVGEWPDELPVDSIGAYINRQEADGMFEFDEYKPLLISMNNAANAIKHSLCHMEATHVGVGSPLCVVNYMRYNRPSRDVELIKVSINDVESKIDAFIGYAKGMLGPLVGADQ